MMAVGWTCPPGGGRNGRAGGPHCQRGGRAQEKLSEWGGTPPASSLQVAMPPPPFLPPPLPWQAPACPPACRHPAGPAGWSVGALLVEGEVGGGGGGGGGASSPSSPSGPGGPAAARRALILRCRAAWGDGYGDESGAFAVKACMCGGADAWRDEVRAGARGGLCVGGGGGG